MLTFPADLEEYVQAKVASGKFRSPDEFAVEAMRWYRDAETRHAQLKADIQAALEESRLGLDEPLDMEAIKQELIDEFTANGQVK